MLLEATPRCYIDDELRVEPLVVYMKFVPQMSCLFTEAVSYSGRKGLRYRYAEADMGSFSQGS